MKFFRNFALGICFLATVACSQNRDEAAILAAKAGYAISDGNIFEGRRLLSQAIEMRPDVVEYRVALAGLLVDLEELEEANGHYQHALELASAESDQDPERVDDHIFILIKLDKREEAMAVLKDAIERFPDSETVRLLLDNQDSLFEAAGDGD